MVKFYYIFIKPNIEKKSKVHNYCLSSKNCIHIDRQTYLKRNISQHFRNFRANQHNKSNYLTLSYCTYLRLFSRTHKTTNPYMLRTKKINYCNILPCLHQENKIGQKNTGLLEIPIYLVLCSCLNKLRTEISTF